MAPETAVSLSKGSSETPYKLDQAQVFKASGSLIKHIKSEAKRKEASTGKKNLLAAADGESEDDDDATAEPIWLQLTTKKHIVDQKRLKPGKILLPHTLDKSAHSRICIITPDPQRAFKDVLSSPAFPAALAKQIRIIGIAKIKTRYKTFESRRQLLAEYDIFLADDRIVSLLPKLLGKIMFESSKRPVPVRLEGYKQKDAAGKRAKSEKGGSEPTKSVATPALFAKEVEKALSSARIHLSPSVTTSVKIGFSDFTAQEIADNVAAVVTGMIEKFIPKGWRNIRTIHIKGPNTAALPVWMSDELWVEDEDVIEDGEAAQIKALEQNNKGNGKGKKRKMNTDKSEGEDALHKKTKRIEGGSNNDEEAGFSKEMAERRAKLRAQKEEARETAARKVTAQIEMSVATVTLGGGDGGGGGDGVDGEGSSKKEAKKEKKRKTKTSERALIVSAAA